MRKEDCFFLGTITKKHGTEGGLLLKIESDQPDNYHRLESVLVNFNEELIPFFISELTVIKPDQLRVFFEDLSPRETDKMIGTDVFLPLEMLPRLTGKKFYFHEIEGFSAIDTVFGEIGTISHVIDRQIQPLIVVLRGDKEIYIPAVDDIIQSIDRNQKVMYFQCPEGLIDLYL